MNDIGYLDHCPRCDPGSAPSPSPGEPEQTPRGPVTNHQCPSCSLAWSALWSGPWVADRTVAGVAPVRDRAVRARSTRCVPVAAVAGSALMTLTGTSADVMEGAAVTEPVPEAPAIPDEPVIDIGYLSLPAELQQAIEAATGSPQKPAQVPTTDDSGQDSPASPERSGGHAGVSEHEGPPPGRAEKDAAAARTLITDALLGELGRRLGEYENAITWGTSCLSCSSVLDSSIRETERRERAEAKLADILGIISSEEGSDRG